MLKSKAVIVRNPEGHHKDMQPKLLPANIVQQLRSIVSPASGKKGSWMQYLDDIKLSEIYRMFKQGKSARKIAAKIQDDWGMYEDVRVQNLIPALSTFRKEALGEIYDLPDIHFEDRKNEVLSSIDSLRKKGGDAVKGIDALAALADVILIERGRIESRVAHESITGKFDSYLSRDLSGYANLLEIMMAMQQKLGLIDFKNANTHITHLSFNAAIQSLPEGTARLAKAADMFMQRIKELPTKKLVMQADRSYGVDESEVDDDLSL